jgi:phosphonate transport system substrate-binding protein
MASKQIEKAPCGQPYKIRWRHLKNERSIHVKKVPLLLVGVLLLSSLLAGCATKTSTAVKEPDTITIAWTPNNTSDNQQQFRAEFDKVIADATGKKVQDRLTTDYNIAMAALDSGDAQLGYFGPFEYMTEHAKDPKIVPLVVESGPSGTLSDALYHSRLLVKKGNEDQYKSGNGYALDNLAGKKISFVSTSSTSGFNVPATAIAGYFSKQDKWKNLTKDDLMQGGNGKFFSQVIFAGSHQLSLFSLLTGKADVAAVDDIDVAGYVNLTQGTDEAPGAVYAVRQDAADPFSQLGGAQFVIIDSIPVLNTPIEANSNVLSQETLDKITQALTSDQVTNDPLIFAPKSAQYGIFTQPNRFLKVEDAWYNPLRQALGIS